MPVAIIHDHHAVENSLLEDVNQQHDKGIVEGECSPVSQLVEADVAVESADLEEQHWRVEEYESRLRDVRVVCTSVSVIGIRCSFCTHQMLPDSLIEAR